jgi:hypothetical protein
MSRIPERVTFDRKNRSSPISTSADTETVILTIPGDDKCHSTELYRFRKRSLIK